MIGREHYNILSDIMLSYDRISNPFLSRAK